MAYDTFFPCSPRKASTSFDGDAVASGTYTIDIDAVFDLPAVCVTAVAVRLSAKFDSLGSTPAGNYALLKPYGEAGAAVIARAQAAGFYSDASGIVPVTEYGDSLAMDLVLNANSSGVVIEVYGYFANPPR